MATSQTYNTGRVVGWSAYEEFLKENPDVDPSVVTQQIYYEAVTYGVSYQIDLDALDWEGTHVFKQTKAIPGAIWGVVPIIGAYYDGLGEGFDSDTEAFQRLKDRLDEGLGNIFSCYVSNSAGVKLRNATSEGGYITFVAHPEVIHSLSRLPIIIRGLGVEALQPGDYEGHPYFGPQGLMFGGNGLRVQDWAQYVKTSYQPIPLQYGKYAYRLVQESKDDLESEPRSVTFLSFSDSEGNVYDISGSDGDLVVGGPSTTAVKLDWHDLLYALSQNVTLDFTRSIKRVIATTLEAGPGISIEREGDTITISNTRPYDPAGISYTQLNQYGYAAGYNDYKVVRYNSFTSYDEGSGKDWFNIVRKGEWEDFEYADCPIATTLEISPSSDKFTYNGELYPTTISIHLSATVQEDSHQYCLAKRCHYDWHDREIDAGLSGTPGGFYFNDRQDEVHPGFALRHGDGASAGSYIGTPGDGGRWETGLYSHILGISFNLDGSNYKYIHDLIDNRQYRFKSTTAGDTGIWNIRRLNTIPTSQDSQGKWNGDYTSYHNPGGSWPGSCQIYLNLSDSSSAGRDNCDLLITANSYGDGHNDQLTVWSNNDAGRDLLSHHINLEVSGILYHQD